MNKLTILTILLFLADVGYSQPAVVKAVHDGDSYKVQFGDGRTRWIRLYGVDAPEVVSNTISKNQSYGRECANHMRKLLKGQTVTVDSCLTDMYGRMVAKVYLDTLDITTYMIATGNGWWLNNANIPKEEITLLQKLQAEAKINKIGLWGVPGTKLRPSTFRKINRKK